MDYVKRADIAERRLPGRVVQNAVGHSSAVASELLPVFRRERSHGPP